MRRRLVWIVSLALLSGCGGSWPFEPTLFKVRTDRTTYTDTSTMVVTVKLYGGAPVGIGGCPPPSVSIEDSTGGTYAWQLYPRYFACALSPAPVSVVRLDPGDSATIAIPLTGFTPGTYRADVLFGPAGTGPNGWVAVSNSFVVH